MKRDASTFKPQTSELVGKAMDIVSNSTLGEFKSSADKEDFQRHQRFVKNPEKSDCDS